MISNAISSVQRLDLGVAMREFVQGSPYIGTLVFPVIRVEENAGTFKAVTRESLVGGNDSEAHKRAPGSGYKRSNLTLSEVSYVTHEYGSEFAIDDSQRNKYASEFDYDIAVAEILTTERLIEHEARVAAKLFDTSVFTGPELYTDVSTNDPFDDPASNVIGVIDAAADRVRLNCGATKASLSLVLSENQFNNLKNNEELVKRIALDVTKTQNEIARALAGLLGIADIIVGGAVMNTANQGQGFVGGNIWSNTYAFLGIVNSNPGFQSPTIGRTALWTKDSPELITFDQYREESTRSDVIRSRHHVDEKLVEPFFGHLLKID